MLLLLLAGGAWANPDLDLGTGSGNACGQVTFAITLTNEAGVDVSATSNDINYNSSYFTPVDTEIGSAGDFADKDVIDNIVNPGLYRVGVISMSNLTAIPNGIVMYVTFDIDCSTPEGSYPLGNTPSCSSPQGGSIATDGTDGSIQVVSDNPTTSTSTTTVNQSGDWHMNMCGECHVPSDLHVISSHNNNCLNCHEGTPQAGNVSPATCVACHPLGDAGECNLANVHDPDLDTSCLVCHTTCATEPTTTTTVPGNTWHMDTCTQCHDYGNLHGRVGHNDCSRCHNGAPQSGNVDPASCMPCHPLGDAGECNLANMHDPDLDTSCLVCHTTCATEPTTTTTAAGYTWHMDTCTQCHASGNLHGRVGHSDCSRCHNGSPQSGNVEPGTCTPCHPLGDAGKCNLANVHDPDLGTSCLYCHDTCATEPTTTSSTPGNTWHIDTCTPCHSSDFLHGRVGHGDCAKCHVSVHSLQTPEPAMCMACHPLGDPGKCELAIFHEPDKSSSCMQCHSACVDSTTTTTAGGGSSSTTTTGGGGSSTTSSVDPAVGHTGVCLACHYPVDLHAHSGHINCSVCHNGPPQAGNVFAFSCTECHMPDNPTCNLSDYHGESCLECHTMCDGGPCGNTTTTTPQSRHIDICIGCHYVNELHDHGGHSDCIDCHGCTPQAGNVTAGKCIACHPFGDQGKCSLADQHGETCLKCHTGCVDEQTTSTTTISSYRHIDNCMECHYLEELHDHGGHSDCVNCHGCSTQGGSVGPEKCITCHPFGNAGKCNLAASHGSTCLECHTQCASQPVTTSTISSGSGTNNETASDTGGSGGGGGGGGGAAPTTTVMPATTSVPGPPSTTIEPDVTTSIPAVTTSVPVTEPPPPDGDSDFCPVQIIIGRDGGNTVETLRAYRDRVLSRSAKGRAYITLYYSHAWEINRILISDESLRRAAAETLADIMPEIRKSISDGEKVVSSETVQKVTALIDRIGIQASKGLKTAIAETKKDLKAGSGF